MLRRYKTQIQMLGALLLGVALTMGSIAWKGHMARLDKLEQLTGWHDKHIAANGRTLMKAAKLGDGMPLDYMERQMTPVPPL